MKIRHAIAPLFTALTLTLAACGNGGLDDSQTPTSAPTTTSTTPTSSSTTTETPEPEPAVEEPEVDEPAALEPEPASERGIWAPPGQGTRCPGTDAYVWDYADCNPSNGVIDPDEFYRLMDDQQDEGTRYGNESGVDWQDKNTNSDWSDDEVDAYIACMERYDYNEYAAYNC